jgi:predicted MFS family arabinose efflux permease
VASTSYIAGTTNRIVDTAKEWVAKAIGGPARVQVMAILAAILAVDAVDLGTLSAVSDQLKHAFHIGNTQIGLLFAAVAFIGAAATLPMGVLADRMNRRLVLVVALLTWTAAMVVSGTATSYIYLLVTRLALGGVVAVAWPCVASLTGDFFPARERAGIYGLIISGEMVGAGFGFFVAGEVSSFAGWRWGFYVMAIPSLVLAWVIWRFLPEPARGGQSWLRPQERDPAAATRKQPQKRPDEDAAGASTSPQKAVREAQIPARPELILHEDPTRRSLLWALRYLLKFPTFWLLIVASALVYYFFAGVRAFAMIYFTKHYGLSRSAVSALIFAPGAGALIGVIAGGRVSEWLLNKGYFNARITVPAVVLLASVPAFGFAVWTRIVWIGIILMTVGAGLLAAAVAPIDAARLDIVHPRMWGRGEAGRMALRSLFEGGAPLLFGAMSGWLGGGAEGLMWTFLIMLIPMVIAGSLAVPARHTYPPDVATAAASAEATLKTEPGQGQPCARQTI